VSPARERELVVPRRYRGPAASGNGGWTAGSLAGLTSDTRATVRVSLHRPPPLDTAMPVLVDERAGTTSATLDGTPATVVASAQEVHGSLTDVAGVPLAEAVAAEASYAGLVAHPFPTCFACGTGRVPGDGLRIFPGRVSDSTDAGNDGLPRARVAATWTPDPSVADDLLAATWAAIDCVGGWAGDLSERLMVLASMTARVDALPEVGGQHVVVGEGRGIDGRKTWTASTLRDADGRVVAVAEHLWVAVDPALFNDPEGPASTS
jgi:hypothetical protein